ncbi:hypothetical protein AB0F07_40365, partial [Streptomyces fructofermentans]|uniref:hypothetical protein n=1 Tax=Streptomyces fructofermentans TaxID=152141 RepID=UPI00340A4A35
MDTAAPLTDPANGPVRGLLTDLATVTNWLYDNWYLLALAVAACWGLGEMTVRRLAAHASAERMALELVPNRHFDPSPE